MSPTTIQEILALRHTITEKITHLQDPIINVLVLGFTLTVLMIVGRAATSFYRLNGILKASHTWRNLGHLQIMICDTVRVPFSARTLRHHYIVIPSSMLTHADDIKIALGHEFQHLRQHDVEWELASEFLRPFFFWNPAYYYLKRQIEELRELSCDRRVINRTGFDATKYCDCLLRVCGRRFEQRSLFHIDVPRVALVQTHDGPLGQKSAKLLAARLMHVIENKAERHSRFKMAVFTVMLLTATTAMTLSIQKPDDWSQDRLMLSTIINLDRLEQRNAMTLGAYRAY